MMDSPNLLTPPPNTELKLVKTSWHKQMLSEGDGEPSVRRYVFFITFLFSMAICATGLWVEIPMAVETLTITMIGTSTGAVTVGRFAERE
jgi:hypothetical protein